MFTKKEKESINNAILEERERIKKIIKDTITSKEITFTHNAFNVNKLIKYLNDKIDNRQNR